MAGISETQIARCTADFARHLAISMGGKVFAQDDVLLCDPGLASAFRNLAVPLRAVREAELAQLRRSLAEFYKGNPKWIVWSAFSADLSGAGLREVSGNPVMWRAPAPMLSPAVPITVIPVKTDREVAIFERVRAASYADAPLPGDPGQPDARILNDQYRLWLGRIDGEPVATAATFTNGQFNAIKHISTLTPFRGRGIGAAMTAHAVNSSTLPAILDADPAARRLYRHLGFTTVGQVRFWRPA